ncbi:YnjH family protein [Edwardsiella tarda]
MAADGLLLQCQANPQVLSTNNLRWVVLKKG